MRCRAPSRSSRARTPPSRATSACRRSACCSASASSSTTASSARSRRSTTPARSATARCSSRRGSTPSIRGGRRRSSTPTPAGPTTTCATTPSTCGSRSPSRRTRSSASRGPSTSCRSSPGPSRSASCRRSSSSRSAWTSTWRAAPGRPRPPGGGGGAPDGGGGGGARRARAPALRRLRPRRHPRHPGRPPGRAGALRRRRGRARDHRRRAHRAPARDGRARPAAPRGRDPVPPSRRVQRERHGRLEGARGQGARDRAADGLVPRDQPLLPAPDVRGLALPAVHDGPRPREGGVRRRARRGRQFGAGPPGPRDPLQLDRVQEGPPPVLHRRLPQLGTRARRRVRGSGTVSLRDTRSAEAYARAVARLPGGVNSPVRAMRAIGRTPIFVERAAGAEIVDVDGNRYVDWVCSWGPLIHGPAHPAVLAAVVEAAGRGTTFGAPTVAEVDLADEVARRMAAVPMLRMTSSGTEATMSTIRLARAATGREKLLKFAGAYHGHVDGLLAEAGSGLATQALPASPGVPAAATANPVIVPWNDAAAVRRAFEDHDFAAVLCEPYAANMGLVPPAEGFLELLRERSTETGALLVFDEVITGFRVARGGAQELTAVMPDLVVMGKVLGGGLPAAAYGGRRELRERIAPAGDVYQAGTLSGNPLAVAAGLAALQLLDGAGYVGIESATTRLATGLRRAAGDLPVQVQSVPGLLTVFFSAEPVSDFAGAQACDAKAYARFCRAMLDRGVYPPASQFEAWFPSLAHDERAIDRTIAAAAEAFQDAVL